MTDTRVLTSCTLLVLNSSYASPASITITIITVIIIIIFIFIHTFSTMHYVCAQFFCW